MLLHYTAQTQDEGLPLGLVLRRSMKVSDTLIRKTKRERRTILVENEPAFTSRLVHSGDRILIDLPDYDPLELISSDKILPAASEIHINYEDDYLLICWKPAFLQTHPSPSCPKGSDTLEHRLHLQTRLPVHPVHRLDAETSGLVVFAKTPYIQSCLQDQMTTGLFQKMYLACVAGTPSKDSGEICLGIQQRSVDDFTRIVSPDGQTAHSSYQVLKRFCLQGWDCSLLSFVPHTGRTHQLRVHSAALGCPILGDSRYGTEASIALSAHLGLSRQQLCSNQVRFIHPIYKKEIIIHADDDLEISAYISPSL